ncbi:hypothetical protein ARMSODRAFT_979719 [Armillaria solidipes]|uniref:Retrotransposon gag domain-containing protein n=1 Tax=Armillaria solidipes TaxID=1076256 RepID=A0A2H3B3V3_9AGAR|nr:hypothetical protein ARMSODRAFT_979719 [Armillaria solidipes]
MATGGHGGATEAGGSGGVAGNDPPAEIGWQACLGAIQGNIYLTHNINDPDYSPHAANQDTWSLSGVPPKWGDPLPEPQPSSTMANDAPWTGCWPKLIRKPKVFKGDSDNIKRTHMFPNPYKVTFAQSYFEGKALDWWTLELEEMESESKKFCDAAIKEVYKKKMYDLHMGTRTTQEYFQELEKQAKQAGL